MTITSDRPKHVVLYAVHKWHTTAYEHSENDSHIRGAAAVSSLRSCVGPVQYYSPERVARHLRELRDSGYVATVRINDTAVGYELTPAGSDRLTQLGVPAHFDHAHAQ
jgi:DNA-binding HxlR family transcriptional regulator